MHKLCVVETGLVKLFQLSTMFAFYLKYHLMVCVHKFYALVLVRCLFWPKCNTWGRWVWFWSCWTYSPKIYNFYVLLSQLTEGITIQKYMHCESDDILLPSFWIWQEKKLSIPTGPLVSPASYWGYSLWRTVPWCVVMTTGNGMTISVAPWSITITTSVNFVSIDLFLIWLVN